MRKPRVSVIIPTYNRDALLKRAIKSVLNQTYKEFEIIVVDDGSTDKTFDVVKKFEDKRIKYIRLKERHGASHARNIGIKLARGKYIAFLDSDDEWLPKKLEKQINVLENSPPKVGVVYTGYWIIWDNKKFLGKIPKMRGYIFEDELLEDHISPTSCILLRKICIEKVGGFDEELPARQDYDLWIRISKFFEFEYIREPLVKIHFHTDHRISSQNSKKQIKAEFKILRKIKKYISSKPRIYQNKIIANHLYVLGLRCWMNKDCGFARKMFIKAIRKHPFNWKYFLALTISLLGNEAYYLLSLTSKLLRTKVKIDVA